MCLASSAAASSRAMPIGAVTRGMGVMISKTRRSAKSAGLTKRRSLFVMMPRSLPVSSTTGSPETRY
ncbi:hypothetical protein D3C74_384820 [compost metagenome]